MNLIDKEALIAKIEHYQCNPCKDAGNDYNGVRCRACQYDDEIGDIDDAPTVDAIQPEELRELVNKLYDEDAITFRGLADINQLIGKHVRRKENRMRVKSDTEYIAKTGHTIDIEGNIPLEMEQELVRCKDCIHWKNECNICWCEINSKMDLSGNWNMFLENDFCCYGERKTE